MIAQPSTKEANWRAGVAIATEQLGFVSCSLGENHSFFFFTCFLCDFLPLVLPIQTTARLAALLHTFNKEALQRGAKGAQQGAACGILFTLPWCMPHCAVDAHRHWQSCSLLYCRRCWHTIILESTECHSYIPLCYQDYHKVMLVIIAPAKTSSNLRQFANIRCSCFLC